MLGLDVLIPEAFIEPVSFFANDARAKVRAENGRGNPRVLAAARRTIASDETAVQEARTAFEAGDYPASIDKSKGATARLRAAIHDLDAPTPTTGRRRH